ncbi:MAG: TIGR02147 family protein [Pseudobdellovibrionaceae bacterium]
MNHFPSEPIEYLKVELEERQRRSASYSLRAFARDLSISPSTLSELLNGKVGLSKFKALDLARKMKLKEEHCMHFCDLILARHARKVSEKREAEIRSRSRIRSKGSQLSLDYFKLIEEWYHFAILELIDLGTNKHSIPAIADSLSISKRTVVQALDRLERLNLIEKTETFYKTVSSQTTVGEEIPSLAVQSFHRQILKKAEQALNTQEVSNREFQSHVLSMRKEDMPELKKHLDKMSRELFSKFLHKEGKDTVYCFSLQFFPLSHEPPVPR